MILKGGDICPIKGEYRIVDYNGKLHGRAFADAGDSRMKTSLNVPEKAAFLRFSPYSPLKYSYTSAGDCTKNHQKCRPFRSLREFSGTNRGLDKAFARSCASALQAQTTQYQARFARQISSSLFSFG